MPPEGENGSFILRGKLILAECLLFASVEHIKANRRAQALQDYKEGILLLQKVLVLENVFRTVNNIALDRLPDFRNQDVVVAGNKTRTIHPYAGYETIGTGVLFSTGGRVQQINSSVAGDSYDTIDRLQKELKANLEFQQGKPGSVGMRNANALCIAHHHQRSTTDTARDLLSDFCPWGVELFHLLESAGLAEGLDLRILRPYAGRIQTAGEKFINGLKQIPDLLMSSPMEAQDKLPPVINELVIQPPQVPKHIYDDMHAIIGDRKKGYLDTYRNRPIEWAWVEKEPTYTIWYLSPAVFDWQPSDYLWMFFTAMKVCMGPQDVMVDSVLSGLLDSIKAYGADTHIYFSAKIAVDANDKGFLTSDFIEKGEWLSTAAVARKVAGYAFNAAEEQMRQDLYEGIDPTKFSMGKTYNGGPIPPIILRADLSGYEKVPDDQYPRAVQAVRFYLLFPENIANKGPYQGYDLSDENQGGMAALHREKEYLDEQRRFGNGGTAREPVRKLAWNRLPDDPLAAFDITIDFSPQRQKMVFHLTTEAVAAISKHGAVVAELWGRSGGEAVKYAETRINPGQRRFRMELYNKHDTDARTAFDHAIKLYVNAGDEGFIDVLPQKDLKKIRQNLPLERTSVNTKDISLAMALVEMRSQYRLRLTSRGKRVSKTYVVNIDRGRKSQREITGTVSRTEDGVLALEYAPELDILRLEVQKRKGIIPGASP